jgi:hypothetical protein
MKNLSYKSVIAIVIATVVTTSCYEKFDVNSYKPEFTISGFSSVDQIEPSSLTAYWSLDGNLTESVSGAAMTNKGTTFVNGFKGQAMSLDVANKSYTTFNPSSTITGLQSFTISFWVNPKFIDSDNDGGIDGILGLVNLSNPTGFWGNIDWFVENGSNPNSAKIVAHVVSGTKETWMNVSGYKGLFNSWTNHTLTYDAATSKFNYYINGSLGTSATSDWGGAIAFTGSGPMVFGAVQFQTNPSIGCCGNQPWASYLTGYLDEIRIYNKALSAENVNAMVVLQGKGK